MGETIVAQFDHRVIVLRSTTVCSSFSGIDPSKRTRTSQENVCRLDIKVDDLIGCLDPLTAVRYVGVGVTVAHLTGSFC